jgi:hypothetical protein
MKSLCEFVALRFERLQYTEKEAEGGWIIPFAHGFDSISQRQAWWRLWRLMMSLVRIPSYSAHLQP